MNNLLSNNTICIYVVHLRYICVGSNYKMNMKKDKTKKFKLNFTVNYFFLIRKIEQINTYQKCICIYYQPYTIVHNKIKLFFQFNLITYLFDFRLRFLHFGFNVNQSFY